MTYVVVGVRRFSIKANGRAVLREVRRRLELPVPPAKDLCIDLGDDGVVSIVHVTVRPLTASARGILPESIEVHCRTEPGEHLERALAAGWLPVDAAAPASAPPAVA